jgi:hypothetical protein
MKKQILHSAKKAILAFVLLSQLALTALAQPEYSFTNPVHVSGTYLGVGSVYRFNNVKPGTDALVTVKSVIGGITLYSLDETWTGFGEAFQPFINVPPNSNGYVEFEFRFINPGNGNPKVQQEIPITCIDVDGLNFDNGSGTIYEQDAIELKTGYYDFSVSSPLMMVNPDVVGADTWLKGNNMSGQFIDGIDTSNRQVMFTVVNSNLHTIRIKIGARNTSATSSDVRYRSVYFKKFAYPDAFLAANSLLSFTASKQATDVLLNWSLDARNNASRIIVEKSNDSREWAPLTAVSPASGVAYNGEIKFEFADRNGLKPQNYYRLKIQHSDGQYSYSNIAAIRGENTGNTMKVYPTLVNDDATIQITSANKTQSMLRIIDQSGRTVSTQKIELNTGENHVQLNGVVSKMPSGQYTAQVIINGESQNARFIKSR